MLGAALLLMALPQMAAAASAYPSQAIKLVIPFPPGGTTDIVGRILAQKLSEALGKPVVVENKAGAGGLVGTDFVAKSEPDGHTLLLGNSGALAAALSLFPAVPYNVTRDFAPISMISDVTIVLAVNPKVPANSVAELVAFVKDNPGKLNAAIPSIGSMHHLLTEMFKISAGINLVSVPYKGSAPAIVDLIGGQVQTDFDNLPALASYIESRSGEGAGGRQFRTLGISADHSIDEGGRVPGHRRQPLVRAGGSRRHAETDHRYIESRNSENHAIAGNEGAVTESKGQCALEHAGRMRCLHSAGNRALGQSRANVGYQTLAERPVGMSRYPVCYCGVPAINRIATGPQFVKQSDRAA